jgi:serine/threonine protein kinase
MTDESTAWVHQGTLTLPYGTVQTLHSASSEVHLYSNLYTQTWRVGKRISLLGREDNIAVREAVFLSQMDHRNIAKVFDVAEPAGLDPVLRLVEILMPYYEDGSLYDAMAKRGVRYTPEAARKLGIRALRGLAYLHDERRVLHRDVKPGNLFISSDGSLVKVGDFGEAMAMDESGECDPLLSPQFWSAPETFSGHRHSVASEIYSVGMSLRELLSGPLPYDDYSREDLARNLAAGRHSVRARDLAFQPHIPECLRRVARKSTNRDPRNRYGSADEMIAALVRARFIDWQWPEADGEDVVWLGAAEGTSFRVVARQVRGRGWRARGERRYPTGWRKAAQVSDVDGASAAVAAAAVFSAIEQHR